MRVELEPAFILHRRAYRESSLLIDVFSKNYGKLRVLAKGVRSPRKKPLLLQPFRPLLISWSGKRELKILTRVEEAGALFCLTQERLVAAFYLNELLTRLLFATDGMPLLFDHYSVTLERLWRDPIEKTLRLFERDLLQCLGYGLILDREQESNQVICPDSTYHYDPERGPMRTHSLGTIPVSGKTLSALYTGRLEETLVLTEAKRLLRSILLIYLGGRPLETRKLYPALKTSS